MMKNHIIYRPFEAHDQVAARQLILNGLGEHFGSIDETRNPDLDNIMENYVATGGTVIVALLYERIVGTGALITEEPKVGRIVRMSVASAYRRNGIGKTILLYLIYIAHQRGYIQLRLETNNDWYNAINFYKSIGFTPDKETEHNVHMSLLL